MITPQFQPFIETEMEFCGREVQANHYRDAEMLKKLYENTVKLHYLFSSELSMLLMFSLSDIKK